jgi:hypothetical protein
MQGLQRRSNVPVAVHEQRRDVDVRSTSRTSSADARAMARNRLGWNDCMLARKASTVSRGIVLENIVGSNAPTNSSRVPSANASA